MQLTLIEYWVARYKGCKSSEDKKLCLKWAKKELSAAMYAKFLKEIES